MNIIFKRFLLSLISLLFVFFLPVQTILAADTGSSSSKKSSYTATAGNTTSSAKKSNSGQSKTSSTSSSSSAKSGSKTASTTSAKSSSVETKAANYVINLKTKVFHRANCDAVKKINEKYRQESTLTAAELTAMGYVPSADCSAEKQTTKSSSSTQKAAGSSSAKTASGSKNQETAHKYVLVNSKAGKVFHEPSCSELKSVSSSQKSEKTEKASVLKSQGYKACGKCTPEEYNTKSNKSTVSSGSSNNSKNETEKAQVSVKNDYTGIAAQIKNTAGYLLNYLTNTSPPITPVQDSDTTDDSNSDNSDTTDDTSGDEYSDTTEDTTDEYNDNSDTTTDENSDTTDDSGDYSDTTDENTDSEYSDTTDDTTTEDDTTTDSPTDDTTNEDTEVIEEDTTEPEDYKYVLNTSTMTIHTPDCYHVDDISASNIEYSNASLEDLEGAGYTACLDCISTSEIVEDTNPSNDTTDTSTEENNTVDNGSTQTPSSQNPGTGIADNPLTIVLALVLVILAASVVLYVNKNQAKKQHNKVE